MGKVHPLILRYLKIKAREREEVFLYRSSKKPLIKPDIHYERHIREGISGQCESLSRKIPIKGNVAVEFEVYTDSSNVVPLGTLLKRHIDMLYPPRMRGVQTDFPGLKTLLENDTQIEYVSANLHGFRTRKIIWSICVIPKGIISEWCKLIRAIDQTCMFDLFAPSLLFEQDDFYEGGDEEFFDDFLNSATTWKAEFTNNYRYFVQLGLLKRQALDFDSWSCLFVLRNLRHQRKNKHLSEIARMALDNLESLLDFGEEQLRKTAEQIIKLKSVGGFIKVPSPKTKKKTFERNLQDKIVESAFSKNKNGEWILPISVSCFYRPAHNRKPFEFDLDNIAQKIIRQVERILNPPSKLSRVGIDHFECKRLGKDQGLNEGEIAFLLQHPDYGKHFLRKLEAIKKRAISKLETFYGWKNSFRY